MKKILLFLTLLIFPFITNAESDVINDFKMDIYIDSNGDAYVTETWNADANMGSEFYHTYNNYGNSTFSDYTVTMDEKEYTFIDNWNVDANIDDKAYKNGFNYTEDGIEICFGKSELGRHTYISKYKISNFILETKDSQIAYWTLLPHNNGGQFKNVYIKIYSDELYNNDLPVWGYGNYGGTAYVYDGYIEMNSEGTLDNDEYMTILVKYPLNTFKTTNIDSTNDFNYYYEMADKGSTHYEEDTGTNDVLAIIAFLPVILLLLIPLAAKYDNYWYKRNYLNFAKTGNRILAIVPMLREIPYKNDIHRAYWVASNYKLMKKQTDFLGAILLKLLKENKIEIKKDTNNESDGKYNLNIILKKIKIENVKEDELYKMMYEASKDGILEPNEFENWCKVNYSKITEWLDDVMCDERINLENENMLTSRRKKRLLTGENIAIFDVNPKMMDEAKKMKGLKVFLEKFSIIGDKEAIEVKMWEEYLIYAQIFGIADKVAKQFKKLYPEVFEEYDYDIFEILDNFNSTTNKGIAMANATKKSRSEARAKSYNSGGGGFSSGGGGNGSFGGGGSGGAGGR